MNCRNDLGRDESITNYYCYSCYRIRTSSLTDKADDVDREVKPGGCIGPAHPTFHVDADDDGVDDEHDDHEDLEALRVGQPAGHQARRLEPRVDDLHAVSPSFRRRDSRSGLPCRRKSQSFDAKIFSNEIRLMW